MSVAVGVLTAAAVLLAPAVHFVLSYERVAGSLEAEVELGSHAIGDIVAANPEPWRTEQAHLSEVLSRRPRTGQHERRRLLDAHGDLVAESVDPLSPPIVTRSLPLLDAGVPVGSLEISRSARPLLLRSLAFALALLPVGVLAFFGLHTVPLRAVRASQGALRRERDTAQKYLDVAGVAFVILDAEGRVSLVNRKGAEILGLPEGEIVGKPWLDSFVDPADRPSVAAAHAAAAGQGLALEYRVIGRAERRTVSWYFTPLAREEGVAPGLLGSGVDVTEQRQLEERLRQAHKLEAVGLLAGGVAHDFNNILSAIQGCASSVRAELDDGDPHLADVDEILDATRRAAAVTKGLLTFSRRQLLDPEAVDLVEILRRSDGLLRSLLREDIRLDVTLPPEPLPVLADAIQIEQVIVNLVANARDAIRGEGGIAVSASRVDLDVDGARRADVPKAGAYARVSVTDGGVGLDAQARARLFEPFFTTKEVGKGTGLGLAIAWGIVTQHHGSISVASEPGRGSTFTFLLPLEGPAAPAARRSREAAPQRDA